MDINSIIGLSLGAAGIIFMAVNILKNFIAPPEKILNSLKFHQPGSGSNIFTYQKKDFSIARVVHSTEEYFKISMKHIRQVNSHFTITNETTVSKSKKLIGNDDITTGDKSFDQKILITKTKPEIIIPLLSQTAREKILKLQKKGEKLKITEKKISIEISTFRFKSIGRFHRLLDLISEVSGELTGERELKNRIKENISSEENPEIIIRNIEILINEFGLDRETLKILEKMLASSNFESRLFAARHLERKGRVFLYQQLSDHAISEKNIIQVIKNLQYNSSRKLLKELFSLFDNAESKNVRLQIIETLKLISFPETETFLTKRLPSAETEIQISIIEALGIHGKKEVIEKIYRIGKNSINPWIRKAVDASIQQIQERLGDVERGWLTLSEDNELEGSLSISSDPKEGALSLKRKK